MSRPRPRPSLFKRVELQCYIAASDSLAVEQYQHSGRKTFGALKTRTRHPSDSVVLTVHDVRRLLAFIESADNTDPASGD